MGGLTRLATARELEIRNENRYSLHPQGKKRCTKCECVYDNIKENFDIHHIKKNGSYAYTGQCKKCITQIHEERTFLYKTDIRLYVKRLLPSLRCRAKEKSVAFELTHEDLIELWENQNGNCFYTNQELDLSATTPNKKHPHINFPSVDRMDPAAGYTKDNIVWTLFGVNRMKNDFTKEQFINFCKVVAEKFK